jgi:hypothetical protein
VFLLPFSGLGGASSGSPGLIARLLAKAGLILFSPFTMAKKSALKCFRASPSTLACSLSICSSRPNPSLNADVPHAGAARPAAGRRLASIR